MKRKTFALLFLVALSIGLFAQGKKEVVEVLYFKAELACCKARACNALEADVQKVVETNFKDQNVAFKEIKLSDSANAELVQTYNAKSQTVVIVTTKKKKATSSDVSDVVASYSRTRDYAAFEKQLTEKINETL